MRPIRPITTITFAIALLLSLTGCGPGNVPAVRLHDDVERHNPRVVVFLVDGLSPDVLQLGCYEGWCPNIQRRFVEGGTRVENAVTTVPSITYAALSTYATGVTPARHGVIANKWFDRESRLLRNYISIKHYRSVNDDFETPTIYELADDKTTVSIQNAIHRGVTKNVANWAQSGVRWFFKDFTAVDKLTASTINYVARWANRERVWPELLVCYFPGVDSVGHEYGPNSEEYRDSIEHIDHQIGRVCDWLEREELLDRTTLVLTSDHGHVDIYEGVIDLMPYLRDTLGRKVSDRPLQDGPFDRRRRHFDQFDSVYVASAARFATIHFRGHEGWDERPSPEEVAAILETPPAGDRLWDNPGVDLAAYRLSENEIVVRTPRGDARIIETNGEFGPEYRYIPNPDDVFDYLYDQALAMFVHAGFHTDDEWLQATHGQQYPDVVPQLIPLLRSPHAGDVILFAAHGYGFTDERGGHGGVDRYDMRIPMMFAGPEIPPGGIIDTARAADLAPTLLEILHIQTTDADFDGVSLWSSIRDARRIEEYRRQSQ